MLRLIWRSMWACGLTLVAVSGMILAWPYDTNDLHTILPNPADCDVPCWQNIRPGRTTLAEAQQILADHAWIGEITIDEQQLQWTWSGQQPALIDDQQPGQLTIRDDVVSAILVQMKIGMGDLAVLFGSPQWQSTHHARGNAVVRLSYPREHLTILVTMRCPTHRATFWMTQPQIRLQLNPSIGIRFTPYMLAHSVDC